MDPRKRQQVLQCIAATARELPDFVVESIAVALEALAPGGLSEERAESLVNAIQGSAHRLQLQGLFRCLAEASLAVPPGAIAWALRGAAAQDANYRESGQIDLVWSGPGTLALTPRRSDQALIEVIDRSMQELFVTTFVAYRVPAVRASLQKAVQRRVCVRLILESNEARGGKIGFDPLDALSMADPGGMEVYLWPMDQRPADAAGHRGSLHMKCAVADESLVVISSANLTEHAFDLNMELGVIVRSRDLGSQLAAHFRELIQRGILRRLNHRMSGTDRQPVSGAEGPLT
jgi:phosphatidylserine/phosphatidylglycerophosphate/cardiolipin synthase-like enzyme